MKGTGVILIFGLLTRAFTAPIDISVDKKDGPRVTTKEILNLEQQLKAQAGEDKKFFASDMKSKHVPPPQQVDGLEDHPTNPHAPEKPALEEEQAEVIAPDEQLEPVQDQLDMAQLDELKAAEKRNQHVDLGGTVKAVDGGDLFERPADAYTTEVGGMGGNHMDTQEYEQQDGEQEEDEQEEEEEGEMKGQQEDDEALFMQGVIDALRDRPELLQQFLQGRLDEDVPQDTRVPEEEDSADRADVIRAEYLEALGGDRGRQWGQGGYVPSEVLQSEELLRPTEVEAIHQLESSSPEEQEEELAQRRYLENYQQYQGDKAARVVKKGFSTYGLGAKSSQLESDGVDENEEELELQKRVDMGQHLTM